MVAADNTEGDTVDGMSKEDKGDTAVEENSDTKEDSGENLEDEETLEKPIVINDLETISQKRQEEKAVFQVR